MIAMKNNVVMSGIMITLVLYIIFLHCITSTRNAGISLDARLLLTTGVWAENADMDVYLCVLEMLDRNDVVAAKERIQQLLYIRIVEPPMWKLMDSSDVLNLKAERIKLLKRIKKYHEEHKDEIDMEHPTNKRAVQQFDNLM